MGVAGQTGRWRRRCGAAVLVCLGAGQAGAEPIHITVTEAGGVYDIATPGEVALYSTPVHYEVVPRDAFAGALEDLAAVLDRSLGVQVQQSGGLGSFSTVSLRGAASEQVLVFVDGVALNDAAGGGVDLGAIDIDALERIEIYRGATPLELGGASIGGAVNLVTRKPLSGSQGHVLLGAGSFGTRRAAAGANLGENGDRWLLNAGWQASDNDFPIRNDNGTRFNPDDDFEEPRRNADFEQANVLLKWRHAIDDDSAITTAAQGFSKRQGLPDLDNSDSGARFDTDSLRLHARLDRHRLRDAATSASAGAHAEHKEERFDDRGGAIGLLRQHTLGTTRRYGVEGFVNRIAGATTVRAIGDVLRESYEFDDLEDVLRPSRSEREAATLGLELNRYLLDNRLIVSAIARQQWVTDQLEVSGGAIANSPVDEDKDYRFFSPQLGLKYMLDARSHVKANIGRYARIPGFFELFGDRGFLVGNADLEPETGVNADVGLLYQWFAPGRWYHDARFEAEIFHTRAEDLIVRVFNARGVGRSENVSDATIDGLSMALALQPARSLETALSATFLDTRIDSDLVAFDGNQLPNRFAETWRLTLAWRGGPWRVSAQAETRRGMYYDAPNLLRADDQEQLNLALRYRVRTWSSELRIDNALDEALQDFNGFPRPGRQYLLNVSAHF